MAAEDEDGCRHEGRHGGLRLHEPSPLNYFPCPISHRPVPARAPMTTHTLHEQVAWASRILAMDGRRIDRIAFIPRGRTNPAKGDSPPD